MSGRGVALLVIAGLTVLCVAGLAGADAMMSRNVPWELTALVDGMSFACFAWALLGFAWWLSGELR